MSAAANSANLQDTGADVEPVVLEAARWLVLGERDKSRSTIPQLRERFRLSLKQASEACREAALIRARAH